MKINSLFHFFGYTSCLILIVAQPVAAQSKMELDPSKLNYAVTEDVEWTNFFKRSSGWYGADGIFAIPLDGKENVATKKNGKNFLVFSDSMIGEIKDGKQGSSDTMLNNTTGLMTGSDPVPAAIKFHWNQTPEGKPATVFMPATASSKPKDYYWLGDGFANTAIKNNIYLFGFRMHNMESKVDWSFRQMATDLIVIPVGNEPYFSKMRQIETPLQFPDSVGGCFGAGIFVNTKEAAAPRPDGYVYVYGAKGKDKSLVVARVLPKDFENFAQWRFWDGEHWSGDMMSCASLTERVSNELSVTPMPDGRVVLVYQLDGMGPTVAMRIGAGPTGPFGPMAKLYDCPEGKQNKNYITYNAKAHPTFSKPGELIISYNVNAFDFSNEIKADPYLYRPRFLKLKFN